MDFSQPHGVVWTPRSLVTQWVYSHLPSFPQGFYWVHMGSEPKTGTGQGAVRGAPSVPTWWTKLSTVLLSKLSLTTSHWRQGTGQHSGDQPPAVWKAEDWAIKHRGVSVSHWCSDTKACCRNETGGGDLDLTKAATKSRITSTTSSIDLMLPSPIPR